MITTRGKAFRKQVMLTILCLGVGAASLGNSDDGDAVARTLQGKNTPESGLLLDAPGNELRDMLVRFDQDHQALQRSLQIPMSEARRDRLEQFYKGWLDRAKALNFKPLSQNAKVDYILFENFLSYRLRRVALTAEDDAEVAPIIPFAEGIIGIQESRQRMEPIDPPAAASKLDALREARAIL